jgi:CheY-like chemotaxis protein
MKKKVLVVEDEALVAMLLTKNLKSMGFDVCGTIASGEEAIQATRIKKPDIIIMDRRLAGKLDGLDASRQIRQFSQIPIVFVTGYIDEKINQEISLIQPAMYLVKPVPINEIKSAIDEMMGFS